jgi:hypothetical protein
MPFVAAVVAPMSLLFVHMPRRIVEGLPSTAAEPRAEAIEPVRSLRPVMADSRRGSS